ncbi:DUF222 domain-containing protein [Dermatophilaceae bacterium Soc4.6]
MTHEVAVTTREAASDLAHEEAAVIAARLHRAEADLIDLAVRVVDDELWAGGGILSPEHWLVLRVGLSPTRAHDVTRIARRWAAMPTLAAAVRAGSVSLDQAAVVAKHAPPDHERSATELAVRATVPQLRRALSRYQFAPETAVERAAEAEGAAETVADEATLEPQTPPPAPATVVIPPLRDPEGAKTAGSLAWALQPPELTMGHVDGRFWMRFSAPSDVGALVEQAVLEAKDALFRAASTATAGDGPDGSTATVTGADAPSITLGDALIEVASRSLSSIESASRSQRYRVYVHLSSDGSWINGRGAIPPSLAAKFACDGVVQPIWEVDGAPVSVGRDQRIVPDRSRRLIEDRDRGCRYPGCCATRHVEVHHLDHWAHGGATDINRMLSLCPRHHDGHHRGEFSMEGDPDRRSGVVFRNHRGREIRVGPPPGESGVDLAPAASATSATSPTSASSAGHAGASPVEPLTPYRGPAGDRLITKWVTLPSDAALGRQDAWKLRVATPASVPQVC